MQLLLIRRCKVNVANLLTDKDVEKYKVFINDGVYSYMCSSWWVQVSPIQNGLCVNFKMENKYSGIYNFVMVQVEFAVIRACSHETKRCKKKFNHNR